ncbi:MAG TPA: hypothetical protein VI792_07605 [Candidatus Eisenbacteria bacterium]
MSRTIRADHARGPTPLPPSILFLLAGALLLGSGCATLGGAPARRGGDGVSVAAKEAKKEPTEKRRAVEAGTPVSPPPVTVTAVDVDVDEAPRPRQLEAAPGPPEPRKRFLQGWDLGLVGGGDLTFGSMLEPGGELGISVGRKLSPTNSLAFNFTATPRQFTPASGFVGAFDDPADLAFDVSLRHALTRDGRPLPVAPMIGFRFGSLSWDYHQPIWVDDGGSVRPVTSDFLDTYSPYAGVAMTLVQTRRVNLQAIMKAGVRFYGDHTLEGLANDSFRTTGFFQAGFETRFPF